jgi:hypothetical protein
MSSEESILFANNLIYQAPIPSSLTVNRCLKRQYFQNRTYSSQQTMTCQLNTGVDFVDTKNSALVLKVRVQGGANFTTGFGSGSAMNLVRNIRIYHRSGTCYTNTQRMNLFRKIEDRYNESAQWFGTIGTLMGYNSGNSITNAVANQDTITCLIPLNKLHPFFDPESGVFLPSQMASGLRLEIDLSTLGEAFLQQAGGALTDYVIDDVYIQSMSCTLMDSAQASLNTVSQKQSLEYVYRDIFTSQNSQPSDSTTINVDLNRSVGFADHAFTSIQTQSQQNNVAVDSFTAPYYDGDWWYTLGSNQYPNQKVDDVKSAYSTALVTFDKFKMANMSPTSVAPLVFQNTDGIYSVSLERDTSLALSQSPVNASRALRFELTLDETIGVPTLVVVFMVYMSSARSSLLSSKVDI